MSRDRDNAKRNARIPQGTTDPTTITGSITGDTSDPYARDSVVVDLRNAVLLDRSAACTVTVTRSGQPDAEAVVLSLAGKLNQRTERAEVIYLLGADGAAALVAELVGVFGRAGAAGQFTEALDRALEAMPT